MPVLIVADDLTGAADCAVQFRQAGFSAVVLTAPASPRPSRFQVVSLSLHTRDASTARVRRVWERQAPAIIQLAQQALVYQKIDSTLRGHPALEVGRLRDLLNAPAAVIAPAFPKQGRQTIDGVHRVQGIPLAETEFARTSARPLTSSRLLEIFQDPRDGPPVHLPWSLLEQGAGHVAEWLKERLRQSCRLITADAAHEGHLDTLTQAVFSLKQKVLLVGSAGWAERLALAYRESMGTPRPMAGALGVVGSLNHVATEQVHMASAAGATVVPLLPIAAKPAQDIRADAVSFLTETLAAGRHAVIWSAPGGRGMATRQEGHRILHTLGVLVHAVLSSAEVSGLVIVGGETTRMVLRALRASGITLTGQVAAGVPHGRILDGSFAGLAVVTKAGGFGEETALWDCLNFLQQRVPSP
ncbi:MAG: four-carbon acid sugar kinase family protein [Candidatus Entotheonellia bacterium]